MYFHSLPTLHTTYALGYHPILLWFFYVTLYLEVDSASKNKYQVNSWGWRRPVRKGDDLTTFIVPNVETIQEP